MKFLRKLLGQSTPREQGRIREDFPPHPQEAKSREIFDFINSASPADARAWIDFHKARGVYIYEEHFYAAVDKAASGDDDDHISYLADADAEEAEEFLKEMKEDGITISNKVFRQAVQITNTEKAREAVKTIADSTPEQVLSWYLKKMATDFFHYLDESVQEYAELRIKEVFASESKAKRLLDKVYTYILMNPKIIPSIETAPIYRRCLERQLEKDTENAFAYRLLGELCESQEDYEGALTYFEEAYELDDKIGVKRKITKYRKQLGAE